MNKQAYIFIGRCFHFGHGSLSSSDPPPDFTNIKTVGSVFETATVYRNIIYFQVIRFNSKFKSFSLRAFLCSLMNGFMHML